MTKIDKANKGRVDKIDMTSWEKLQMSDNIKQVTREYRWLLQKHKIDCKDTKYEVK